MCIMAYIASDKMLPEIKWNEDIPDFNIEELKLTDSYFNDLRKTLTKKRLYYVGAHEGCGCGFSFGRYPPLDEDDVEQDRKGKASVNKLFQYIDDNLVPGESIELFTCWAGDEGASLDKTDTANIKDIMNEIENSECFYFNDKNEMLIISK